MTIKKRTIEQIVYVSEDGKETPVREMNPVHLINAMLKAERQYVACKERWLEQGFIDTVTTLKDEILYRIGNNLDNEQEESA